MQASRFNTSGWTLYPVVYILGAHLEACTPTQVF